MCTRSRTRREVKGGRRGNAVKSLFRDDALKMVIITLRASKFDLQSVDSPIPKHMHSNEHCKSRHSWRIGLRERAGRGRALRPAVPSFCERALLEMILVIVPERSTRDLSERTR